MASTLRIGIVGTFSSAFICAGADQFMPCPWAQEPYSEGDDSGDVRRVQENEGSSFVTGNVTEVVAGLSGSLSRNARVGRGDDVEVPDRASLRKAGEILGELRRRAGQRTRPRPELDYIDRLLRRF